MLICVSISNDLVETGGFVVKERYATYDPIIVTAPIDTQSVGPRLEREGGKLENRLQNIGMDKRRVRVQPCDVFKVFHLPHLLII